MAHPDEAPEALALAPVDAPDLGAPTTKQRWWHEWPLILVLGTAIAGLAVVADNHFKRGTVIFGCALLLGTFLRAVLPEERAGLLKVRRKWIDVATLGFFAVATVTLAVVVPPPSA